MNKLIKIMLALVFMPLACFATGEVTGIYNSASSGTTSATVFVPPSSEFTNITDLSAKLDNGITTGQVIFRSGDVAYSSTSATSASGTIVWFANSSATTGVAVGEYIIVYSGTATGIGNGGQYLVRQVTAATTTSVTVSESITPALTTTDRIWSVSGAFSRPVPAVPSVTAAVSIWLPRGVPTAITVDGNTTACRISASGVRSNYR